MRDTRSPIRPRRITLAFAIGAGALAMAYAVDLGLTRAWPAWGRGLWAITLLLGMLAAVFLLVNGVGVLSDEALAGDGVVGALGGRERRVLTARHFVGVYVGSLVLAVGLSLWLERAYGVSAERAGAGVGAVLFLLASLARPWWLYATVRRLGWFAAIESDLWMRRVLAVLGAILAVVAVRGGK